MKTAGLKQFINSKNQLLEALKRDPIHRATYEVTKYCKMPVGESKETKQYIPLKPKQTIVVSGNMIILIWRLLQPRCLSISTLW